MRAEPMLDDGEQVGIRRVVCGPYETWTATLTDPQAPRARPARFGTVVEEVPYVEDPNAGIEPPWDIPF